MAQPVYPRTSRFTLAPKVQLIRELIDKEIFPFPAEHLSGVCPLLRVHRGGEI